MKNIMQKIEQVRDKINPYYAASISDLYEIMDHSEDVYRLFNNAFRFGYMQGAKAVKAEMKRKVGKTI